MKYIKQNYKFFIVLLLTFILITIKFPYYIDTPGSTSNVKDKINIKGYESEGSFNIVYVREYKATIPTLIISLFNKNWDTVKQDDVLLETENDESYFKRDKILMDESISNAIFVAFTYANKDINIKSSEVNVIYVDPNSDTNLKVGDAIVSINDTKIKSKQDISNIIEGLNYNDKLNIKVKNNDKEYNKYAYIKNDNGSKKIGLLLSSINEYDTNPKIDIKLDSNESGSSGGLVTALYIYDSLVEDDLTNGLKIVVTGTIDIDGKVGSIGGVKYKLKSAVKNNADIFIVPSGDNYKEAMKLKEKNNYDIDIVSAETFKQVIDYLYKL